MLARVEGGDIVIKASLEEEVSKELLKLSGGAAKAATAAIAGVATGLSAAGSAALVAGASFESAFAGVKKTVDATDTELAQMRQGIRDMAKEMPTSANEIAGVAEAAGQLGIKNEAILSFTKTMVMLGDSTNMASTEAATSLARLANITGMPQANFDRLGSTVVALGNNLATTESEIVEMGLRLAGAGKQVGMSESQILSFASALSSVGIEAEAGGSAFSKVMVEMQLAAEQGGKQLQNFADVAGMSADDFAKAYKEDAAGAMMAFVQGLSTCDERGVSAIATLDNMGISEVRMRDALLRAAGATGVFGQALEVGSQAWEENTALTNEAGQRYETFESKAKMAKNAVIDLGISLYDSAEKPLKAAADAAINYASVLSEAFETGGIEGLVTKAGDIFAEIAIKATEQAPNLVNAAASTIKAFINGIISHRSEIYSAAVEIVTALASGLASLLPSEMAKPAQKAIESLSASFRNGGLREGISDVAGILGSFMGLIGKLASSVLPPAVKVIDLLADNLNILVPAAVASVAAFKGFQIISSLSKTFKSLAAAVEAYNVIQIACTAQGVISNATLTIGQALYGLVRKQVSLATVAHTAWNAVLNANPVGIVVTAVAALAAGFVALTAVMDNANMKSYELTEEQQKVIDKTNETTNALNQQREAREASVQSIDREYGGYTNLLSELQSITDANGNVKAGYEDRARVITGQLSQALGIEIELLDGQIQKYGEVVESIKEVITQKKAEALLSSMQDDMSKAYEKSKEALDAYKEASSVAAEKQKALAEAQKKADEVEEKYGNNTGPAALSARQKANQALEEAQKAYDKASGSMDDAKTSLEELSTEVNNYDALMEAMASGNTAKIEEAMNSLVTSYRSYSAEALQASEETRQEMYNQSNGYVENMKLIQDGTVQVADSVYASMADAAVKSISDFNKLPGGVAQGIKEIGPEASAAMVSALAQADLDGKLSAESKAGLDSFINGFNGLDKETQATWSQAWYGALKGLEGFEDLADPATEGAEAFLESLKAALEVHSPSAAVSAIFAQVWPGAEQGLNEGKEGPLSTADTFIQEFLGKFGESGMGEALHGVGSNIMSMFGLGVASQTGNSLAAGQANGQAAGQGAGSFNPSGIGAAFGQLFGGGISGMSGILLAAGLGIATSASSGAGSINPSGVGTAFGRLFGGGISGMSGILLATGLAIATSARSGAGSINPSGTGTAFGRMFATAIALMKGVAGISAKEVATGAKDKMGSISTYSIGTNFVQGFIDGIGGLASAAISAATSLATSAFNAMKKALDVNSPSRKAAWLGEMTTAGFVNPIKAGATDAEKAGARMAQAALKGMDIKAITSRLQAAVDRENANISSAISANINYKVNDVAIEEKKKTEDYLKELADEIVDAFARAGITVSCGRREIGRLMREV